MFRRYVTAVAVVVFAALLSQASTASGQTVGAAGPFAIVGGQAVKANGAGSLVNGGVGVSPLTSITGFPGSAQTVPPYTTHANDGDAIGAQSSVGGLYTFLAGAGPATPIGPQLNTLVLTPGVYSIGAADLLNGGTLTFNGGGIYIIQVASSLTANTNSTVSLQGGATACNIYWQVTSAATLLGTNFVGNVVALAAVTLGTGDTLVGRALTTDLGTVTLKGGNTIGGCSSAPPAPTQTPTPVPGPPAPPVPPPPSPDLFLTKTHTGNFVVGTNATYGIAIFNSGAVPSSGTYSVTDTLPAGLTFVSATGVGWACAAAGQVVTCTSRTVINLGPGPNNITLTVTPGAAAVPTVVNRAVVSGGGDTALGNNTTVDVAIVSSAAADVPTLPEWAMLALMLLLASAGVLTLRGRAVRTR